MSELERDHVDITIMATDLPSLTKMARLNLSVERQPVAAETLDGMLKLFDQLDSIDLGETPPVTSLFGAWRGVK